MSNQGTTCPYNAAVECGPIDWRGRLAERDCSRCGWNPKVAKARLDKRLPAIQRGKKPAK